MASLHDYWRHVPILAAFAVFPALADTVDCGEEHFVSGGSRLPTYVEAMNACRAEEAAMTHENGAYRSVHPCHDADAPGQHGPWRHGRIAVDVAPRDGGESMTFETLWMCKPASTEVRANDPVERR